MGFAVGSWRALTQVQRETWNVYAAATPWTNRLGEATYLTGMQMYVRSMAYFSYMTSETGGDTIVLEECASLGGLPQNVGNAVATLGVAAGLSLSFDDAAAWCTANGNIAVVRMSLPRNETQVYGARGWKFVGTIVGGTVTPAESPFEITTANLPNVFAAGDRVTFGIRMVHVDGTLSEEIFVDAVAAA